MQGCLTAAFPRRKDGFYDKVYLVDIPASIEKQIPENIRRDSIRMSHLLYGNINEAIKQAECHSFKEYSERRLWLYRDTAKLIITSRMHCAVPCAAMGIPVVFLVPAMSSRFTWMEKLLPIYTFDEIDKVNWNPVPVNYEEAKEWIIQSAVSRIKGRDDIELCQKVSGWYLDRKRHSGAEYNGLDLLNHYAREHWKQDEPFEYLIWGITATANDVFRWLSINYPEARLAAVIDEYRDLEFHGHKSQRSSCLEQYPECYYIGTGASASMAMKKALAKKGREWVSRGCPLIP